MSEQDHPPICDYEGSDYQQSFWEQANRAYEDRVEAVALRRLLPTAGKLLLELGAGAGRNTPRYQGFERVVLLDYSLTQLQQAQARLGKMERYVYVAADVYRLPFVDNLFDAGTMIRVLHHIADVPLAFAQIHRVLSANAIFILEFASKHNLKAILRYWTGKQEWSPFTLEPVEFVPLNFDFHPKQVRLWLEEAGFTTEKTLTVSHFRLEPLKRIVPTSILVWLDSLAQLTGNWWQLTPSVFTRNRVAGKEETPQAEGFFQCPQCTHTPMLEEENMLTCPECNASWAIHDGIYDFRKPIQK